MVPQTKSTFPSSSQPSSPQGVRSRFFLSLTLYPRSVVGPSLKRIMTLVPEVESGVQIYPWDNIRFEANFIGCGNIHHRDGTTLWGPWSWYAPAPSLGSTASLWTSRCSIKLSNQALPHFSTLPNLKKMETSIDDGELFSFGKLVQRSVPEFDGTFPWDCASRYLFKTFNAFGFPEAWIGDDYVSKWRQSLGYGLVLYNPRTS
jgi:hypothetical protein